MGGSRWVARAKAVSLAIAGAIGALAIADHLFPPDLSRARDVSIEVRDRDGSLLRPFLAGDGMWRLSTRVGDVSPRYLAVLKAYEDRRFDTHFGIDPQAAARALYQNATAGHVVSGASTLTMQVARLLHPAKKRGFTTKLAQSLRAVQLELRYSKNDILELYLTLAPFGGNIEGVRAASLSYFGKEPKSLTLAEATLLVALPQSPEHARPDKNPEEAAAAREKVLRASGVAQVQRRDHRHGHRWEAAETHSGIGLVGGEIPRRRRSRRHRRRQDRHA
jgi:penicillin-binding protein 1C